MATNSGYMTLPKPIYANTLWAEYAIAVGNTNATHNTYNRYPRSTPSIYWAVLYNRAFEIIDRHSHSNKLNDGDMGLKSGRPIYFQSFYSMMSGTSGTNRSFGPWFSSDLDMRQGFVGVVGSQNIDKAWGIGNFDTGFGQSAYNGTLSFIPQLAEMQYRGLYFSNPAYGSMPLGKGDLPESLKDPTRYRWSLFARIDYNYGSQSESTRSSFAVEAYPDTYNAFPSIPLLWTTGDHLTPVTEIINNVPGGAIPGMYQYAGFPNSTTDEYMYNKPNTLQPFIGLVDKGENGYEWSYVTSTLNPVFYPYYSNGRGWFASWQASYSLTGTMQFADYPPALDPCTDYTLLDVVEKDNKGVGNNAYTYFAYGDGKHYTFGPTWRYGKFIWINDMSANASTYNQTIEINVDPSGLGGGGVANIRWHGNTASPKHWASDGSGANTLKLEVDREAFMIVKATSTLWFAYFKQ